MMAINGQVPALTPGGWIILGGEFKFWPSVNGTATFPYISKYIVLDGDGVTLKETFTSDDDTFVLSERLLTLGLRLVRLLLALRRDAGLLGGLWRLVRRPGLLGLGLVRRLLPPRLLRLPVRLLGLRRARLPVHRTALVLRSSVGVLVLIHRRSFDP
jgi:hypothetical protein